ncbi:MAG: LON peptidase substrate-binding domain-containing protein, partial [Selenomonadaceae bacterium]|nr:LON peptidase substrate-binding domain-containing protein [Selenomonadaceae bacterium]
MTHIIETVTLPLVPLRGVTVFPNMIMHLDIGRENSIDALEAAMVADRRIFLVAQKDSDDDNPKREGLYTVGTVAEVRQIMKMPDGNVRVLVEGNNRAVMTDYRDFENYTEVDVEVYEDAWEDSLQLEALVKGVVHEFEEWVKLSKRIPSETFIAVTILEDIGRLADLITSHLNLKLDKRQELLEALDVEDRLERLYAILARELDVLQMEVQINQRVRGQIEKIQKDSYLREQLRAIHKELGEDEDVSETSSEYRKKLEEGNYPDEVKEIVNKELTRMERLPAMAQESSVIRTYIEWLFDLPWNIQTEDSEDIAKAAKVLDADHYG